MNKQDKPIIRQFENQDIRIFDNQGEAWFVASDVCRALNLKNSRNMLKILDKDEKGVTTVYTLGGPQLLNIISEPGLYSLIMQSRKEEAKRFKRWVTHDVLPQIRQTGSYNPQVNKTIAKLANRITQLVMEKMELTAENRYLKQYHPDGVLGERSEESGLPRTFYRKAAYVSRYGRRPKPKESYRQLDLFLDLPALQEARDALSLSNTNRLLQ